MRASKPHGIQKIKKSQEDSLLRIERIPEILGITEGSMNEDDPECWHAQVICIVSLKVLVILSPSLYLNIMNYVGVPFNRLQLC